jgi:GTP-binding protein
MKKLNRVLIVGRTNIGKSTLFNRLSSTVKSLILDEEGVTRDYIKDVVNWRGKDFELVDSAGLSFKKSSDPIHEKMRMSALDLIDSAQLIAFVVDGVVGVLPEDYEISKAVHTSGKKAILLINKIDTARAQEQIHEFDRLGYKIVLPISAQHGTGVTELLDCIVEQLQGVAGEAKEQAEPEFKVVLLGKPNVGKSSLMNALLQEERSLVTNIPGTTREAVREKVQFYKETIELIDTPGVRRSRSVEEQIEELMVKSSLRAVRDANIVLLLIDASQGTVSDQELKLTYYAFDNQKKAVIILFNKTDLVDEEIRARLDHSLEEHQHLMKKVETLTISAKNGKNVGKILSLVHEVWQRYSKQFTQQELVVLFKSALAKKPLYRAERSLHFFTARQIATGPITIVLEVAEPQFWQESQLRFFENVLRDYTDLRGVPVKFIPRKGS